MAQTCLVDVPPMQRFMTFDQIDWNRVFFKTYDEKRSGAHPLVNFNRIWILHVAFYTAFNSPAYNLLSTEWSRPNASYGLVCYCTRWCSRNLDYDCCNHCCICIHSDHFEQYLASRTATRIPRSLPLPYRCSDYLRRHTKYPMQ